MPSWADLRSKPSEQVVILSNGMRHRLVEATDPNSVFVQSSNSLIVSVNASHYSSYSIRLTPSDGGSDIVVPATSATVSIPITNTTADYVITVDGGDYGTYDGLFSPAGHTAVTLSDRQAMQLVKNRREDNTGVHFYSATVNTIINDARCPIDTMPAETWATDTTINKWLIYVDEHPKTSGKHECAYYYITKQIAPQDSLSVLHYIGSGPSRQVRLKPQNFTIDLNMLHRSSFVQNQYNSGNPIADNMRVVIFGPVNYDDEWDYIKRWNECSAFYNILTQQFCIPKNKIDVLMADINQAYNFGTDTIPYDLDGDGVDEFDGSENIKVIIDSLLNEQLDHFVFYYASATPLEGAFVPYPILFEDLPKSIMDIQATYKNIILSSNGAYYYCDPFIATNAVITVATEYASGAMTSLPNNDSYYEFPYYWLSVLSGKDLILGTTLVNDYDINHDGALSINEILQGSKQLRRDQNPGCDSSPSFIIGPSQLANQLSFDAVPQTAILKVLQNNENAPSTITWNSPDIWIRKTDDGITNQESECFRAYEGDSAYIYVRVHNVGNSAYSNGEMKLHLFWEAPHLGVPGTMYQKWIYFNYQFNYEYVWMPTMPNYIATTNISSAIPAGQDLIVKYKWEIPDEVIDLGTNLGHMFVANLDVLITEQDYRLPAVEGDTYAFTLLRNRIVKKNLTTIDTDWLPFFSVPNPNKPWMMNFYYDGKFHMDFCPGSLSTQILNFTLQSDTSGTAGDLFSSAAMPYFEGDETYENTINVSPITDSPLKLKLNGLDSQVRGLIATIDGDWSAHFGCRKNFSIDYSTPVPAVDQTIHLVPVDTFGVVHEGQSVRFFVPEISPLGPPINPGIQSIAQSNGNYTLTESNICEPAKYEWYDSDMNKFDEGKTVTVNRNDIGDYTILKVMRLSDEKPLYAMASFDEMPIIMNVSPVPFNSHITVTLSSDATTDMSVRIISVLGNIQPIEQTISKGVRNVVVDTATLPSGQYVVVLMRNGEMIHSVNIYK